MVKSVFIHAYSFGKSKPAFKKKNKKKKKKENLPLRGGKRVDQAGFTFGLFIKQAGRVMVDQLTKWMGSGYYVTKWAGTGQPITVPF